MWINLSEEDIARLRSALRSTALSDPDKSMELHERLQLDEEERSDPKNEAWIERARELHTFGSSDSREVDEAAVVSPSDEGAYVMMWGWVSNGDMGIEEEDLCRTCGEEYADGGDGFDGECPDCADKTDQKENPENYTD